MPPSTRRPAFLLCFAVLLSCLPVAPACADEPLAGLWRAREDGGDGSSSIIELAVRDDRLTGRIVRTFDASGTETHPVCAKCRGALEGRPLQGMTFISGLRKRGDRWVDGHVIDLRPGLLQGASVSCDMTLVDGRAVIRGYFVARVLGGTSTWTRVASGDDGASR